MASKAVINAYVRRIQRGTITINEVPAVIRREVEEALGEVEKPQMPTPTEEENE